MHLIPTVLSVVGLLAAFALLPVAAAVAQPVPSRHLAAEIDEAPPLEPPSDRRFPAGIVPLRVPTTGEGEGPRLTWPDTATTGHPSGRLRLTLAMDVRQEHRVEARLARSGELLGVFDIRYGYVFQPFEIAIGEAQLAAACEEGVRLRMIEGDVPLWFIAATEASFGQAPVLLPHLMLPGTHHPRAEFLWRMTSLDVAQPFGWMAGCVLDGQADLAPVVGREQADAAVRAHLEQFLDSEGRLRYEDPRSRPADGRIYGIEGSLPIAHLARLWPEHGAVDAAIGFWLSRRDADGCIGDGRTVTAEGCYTVAYPLAVVGRARGRRDLEDLALAQLRFRRDRLVEGEDLFLRHCLEEGRDVRTFRLWARAAAWYLLGMARTLEVLSDRDDVVDLRAEFRRAGEWAMGYQLDDGLYSVFLDDPELEVDTSGSAGIAAALAIGVRNGWLDRTALDSAGRTLAGLTPYLTPDGLLRGVAQSNRGGEALQRADYRVLSQMGMGLMAQLCGRLAELAPNVPGERADPGRAAAAWSIGRMDSVTHRVELADPVFGSPVRVYDVVQRKDRSGLPVEYAVSFLTHVCTDGQCQMVEATMVWNPPGYFERLECPPGRPLTKREHQPFTDADYAKLSRILKDRSSILKTWSLDYLAKSAIEGDGGSGDEGDVGDDNIGVDAVTQPTPLTVQDAVVGDAAYTTWALWRWANGEMAETIRGLTERSCTPEYLDRLLLSDDRRYADFALDYVSRHHASEERFVEGVCHILEHGERDQIARALEWLGRAIPDTERRHARLIESFFRMHPTNSPMVLQKLSAERELPASTLEGLTARLGDLPYFQAHLVLRILEDRRFSSATTVADVAGLLDSDDFFIARRAGEHLMKLELDGEVASRLEAFRRANRDRL